MMHAKFDWWALNIRTEQDILQPGYSGPPHSLDRLCSTSSNDSKEISPCLSRGLTRFHWFFSCLKTFPVLSDLKYNSTWIKGFEDSTPKGAENRRLLTTVRWCPQVFNDPLWSTFVYSKNPPMIPSSLIFFIHLISQGPLWLPLFIISSCHILYMFFLNEFCWTCSPHDFPQSPRVETPNAESVPGGDSTLDGSHSPCPTCGCVLGHVEGSAGAVEHFVREMCRGGPANSYTKSCKVQSSASWRTKSEELDWRDWGMLEQIGAVAGQR